MPIKFVKTDILDWLQDYYESLCNDSWEHTYGIKVDNIDNPGWRVDIDLRETIFEKQLFETIQIERSENDWVICRVEKQVFKGDGGPRNLIEILTIFRSWIEKIEAEME